MLSKKNKKWFMLLDWVIAIAIFSVLVTIYFGWLSMYAKYKSQVNDNFYSAVALTECAEVIHWLRYWEIDKMGSGGWTSYRSKYPTWLYQLEYNDATQTWDLKPIYKDETTKTPYLSLEDMLKETWYTPETEGEVFFVWVWWKKDKIRRYVFINNDLPDKSTVSCSVRYYNVKRKRLYKEDWQDKKYYEELKFTMTDYM